MNGISSVGMSLFTVYSCVFIKRGVFFYNCEPQRHLPIMSFVIDCYIHKHVLNRRGIFFLNRCTCMVGEVNFVLGSSCFEAKKKERRRKK